jgi:hypothetical protein
MPVRWETSERVSILESVCGSDIAPGLLGRYENEMGAYPMNEREHIIKKHPPKVNSLGKDSQDEENV